MDPGGEEESSGDLVLPAAKFTIPVGGELIALYFPGFDNQGTCVAAWDARSNGGIRNRLGYCRIGCS
jgi:hypothetical protein